MTLLHGLVHWLAALVVLAEALNKLERMHLLCRARLDVRERAVQISKAAAWALLAWGAGVALLSPLLLALGWSGGSYVPMLQLEVPTAADTAVMLGFALLILKTRIKEG